jgi:hypothetical protein
VTEELPEDAAPVVVAKPPEIITGTKEEIPIKDIPKPKTSKKVTSKPRKSPVHGDEQNNVKKKATG